MKEKIKQLQTIFEAKKKFVLTTHINPDADAVGSEVALARYLAGTGKTVHVLNHSETPDNLLFLNEIFPITPYDAQQHTQAIIDADCFIVLDTNSVSRFKALQPAFERSKAYKVIIDHHLDHESFADLNIIDTHVPATSELLYIILKSINDTAITKPIAEALYAGIMTDTGSFRFPQTDPETHIITADLLKRGAQPYEIFQKIYESGPINKLHLLGKALTSIDLHHNGKVAVMTLPRSIFAETKTVESDVDNLTQYVLSIGGVVIGIVVMELEHGVKLSFRSKGDIPINELAKHFDGGGHKNAAGARVKEATLQSIIPFVLEKAKEFLK
ncbi:MAG: bifunctional oligoribonuclease/PAP phosphatase NrnA [Ignavibacteriales bacterium]|nr:bifunctional oligoribonuclease/PAP phosphatase NrnA [Ignavibacteriales bacterium]